MSHRLPLLGGEVDALTPASMLAATEAFVAGGGTAVIANHNLHSLALLATQPRLRDFFLSGCLREFRLRGAQFVGVYVPCEDIHREMRMSECRIKEFFRRLTFREFRFKNSFIFKYSARPGTKADELWKDDVPEEVKRRRNNELLDAQDEICEETNAQFIGQRVEVLVEGPSKWTNKGLTRNDGRMAEDANLAYPMPGVVEVSQGPRAEGPGPEGRSHDHDHDHDDCGSCNTDVVQLQLTDSSVAQPSTLIDQRN
jgi:hypothetical protein